MPVQNWPDSEDDAAVPPRDVNAGSPPEPPEPDRPPAPGAAFHWVHDGWEPALRCVPLESVAQHLFTSRQRAFPAAPATDRADRWERVAGRLGIRPERLMRVKQVHGRGVRVVRRGEVAPGQSAERPEADALVSNAPGVALLVQVADCVPILIADGRVGAVAAVHAGWRGTCEGIAGAAVEALVREFGCHPPDMVAALGPSIGPDDYEVGDALIETFRQAGHGSSLGRWFRRTNTDGAVHLDLWRANLDQLRAAGVPGGAVHRAELSTSRYPRWFESYRRDGAAAGRMAALIVAPPREA